MCFSKCTRPDKVKDILGKCVVKQNKQYILMPKQLSKLIEYNRFNLAEIVRTFKFETTAISRA